MYIQSIIALILCTVAMMLGVPAGFAAQQAKNPEVVIETSEGNITVELFQDKAIDTHFITFRIFTFGCDAEFKLIDAFFKNYSSIIKSFGRPYLRSPASTNPILSLPGTHMLKT